MAGLPAAPLGIGIGPGVRTSLGGLQGKLAVVIDGEKIGVPLNGKPSTHILKPARLMGDGTEQWPGIPAAEVFGMRLIQACHAKGMSATSAEAKVITTGACLAILVTRFDRKVAPDGSVWRIHQEDFGQALGNCDMHIRNISLLLDCGMVQLTPAYDVVPTSVWEDQRTELSLYVGDEALLADVTAESLTREAASWGMRAPLVRRIIARTVKAAAASLDELLVSAIDEGWHHPVLDLVVEQTARRLVTLSRKGTS